MAKKVWLVTGAASGLGRNIVEAVLAAGDKVVASARDTKKLSALTEQFSDSLQTITHDVRDAKAAESAVQLALDKFGRLDVVVNNAGYGDIRPFEQTSPEAFQALVDTCFYGVVYVTRAALPVMRKQRSGKILQISSVGGRFGSAGSTAYHSAKWAVGGFTEALAPETAPFGVQVCAIEPGSMRTNWGLRASQHKLELIPDYEESVGKFGAVLDQHWGHENSDPKKVAQVILQLADQDHLPTHLLLGSDALHFTRQADEARTKDMEKWLALTTSTDVGAA
jgi:NAD(P)-dependent dehydrogenase (short-subunit alcohol dehydrogenase family)